MSIFLTLSILLTAFVAGQSAAQGSNVIYGIQVDSGTSAPVHLTSFDCSSFQISRVCTFPAGVTLRSFGNGGGHSAFDAYNGRPGR